MNCSSASATVGHCEPIELLTSMTSDRSTIRRVASPELVTVRFVKLASRMNVVGTVAAAVTVTVLTPVAAFGGHAEEVGIGGRIGHRRWSRRSRPENSP